MKFVYFVYIVLAVLLCTLALQFCCCLFNFLSSLLLFVYFVYICPCSAIVVCVFCLHLSLQCCCCLYTCLSAFFMLHFVVAYLLVYPPFYVDVDAITLFIRWVCKRVHNFIFGAFIYRFKNTISIFVII